MEGAKRLLAAEKKVSLFTKFLNFIKCHKLISSDNGIFAEKRLKFRSPVNPDLVKWENLGKTAKNRFMRGVLMFFISIILIALTGAAIHRLRIYGKDTIKELQIERNCDSTFIDYEVQSG